jgi:peptidoglycan hydrolase CwlO-like protein
MPTSKVFFLGALSLFLVIPRLHVASAEALNADTQKSERNYRKTKSGEGALTQKMLEACIKLKTEIDEEFEKISAAKEEFEALNKEVTELSARLQKSQTQLDNHEQKSVREHNAQIELYNNKVEELKRMETAYNEKSGPYKEKTARLEKECSGQAYYEDDYAAAVKKTGKTL